MKKTSYISALLLAASALLLASCAKELGGNGNENYLSFSSNIAEIVQVKSGAGVQADTDSPARFVTLSSTDGNKSLQMELSVEPNTSGLCGSDYAGTKATLQTASVSSFYAMGFNGAQEWFPNDSSTPQQVNVGQTYSNYIWVDGASYNFFAYTNMPASTDVAEASITEDGVSLNYKAMPDGAADQNDILLGRYCGNGKGAGTAEMTFYHPMTAVIFKVGTLDASITAVKSISIDGVYASGSTTLATGTGTPTFTWTPGSDVKTVSQAINSLPGEGALIGVPFVLIPQNLASKNVTVNMTVTTASGDILLTTTLDSGSWEAGKTYTYKVNYMTGPNPDLWVDLGMVSANGYPLYISKRNVAKIENGIAYFTDSEFDVGMTLYSTEGLADIKSQDNLPCRILSASDGFGLTITNMEDANVSWEDKSSYYEVTSLINGNKCNFPVGEQVNYVCDDINNDIVLVYNGVNGAYGFYSGGYIKLVYENSTGNKISLNNFKLYNLSVGKIDQWNRQASIVHENEKVSHSSADWFLIDVNCGNNYHLRSLRLLDGFSHSGYDFKGLYHIVETTVDITITHNSQILKFTADCPKCFVKGTLITLADGSRKKVEDLTYDDELLVWNFDKGCLDSAKPLWLKKSEQSGYYYKVTLSDGTEIKLVGSDGNCHRLFNYTDKVFQYPTRMATGTKIYTENGIATLVSCERIEEETEFYNLITDKHINCFADGVLASCRYNNLYPIDEDMKFVKDGRKKRPYKEFKAAGISREWYNGLRLGEQTDSLADITEYINDRVAIEQPKPAPTFWQRIKTWWKSIFG